MVFESLPDTIGFIRLGAAFCLAAIIAFWVVPILSRAALKYGVVDKPNTPLKNQSDPVPYFGGLGVFAAFLAAVSFTFDFSQPVLGIIFGATLILLLGLIDDFGVLTPTVKLGGQILTGLILIKAGIYIKIMFFPEWVNMVLTLFWVVGIVNAFNIIDIMDGLAGTVAFLAALVNGFFAVWNGQLMVAVLSAALAGAIFGFLKHNWRPAKVYLGDTGSMFIGFMLAALAMNNSYTAVNRLALLAPVLILSVPIYDTCLVTFIRLRRGRSPMHGSPDHFAIRLKTIGYSAPKIALLSGLVTMFFSITAIVISLLPINATLILLGIVLAAILTVTWFLCKIKIDYPDDL